MSICFNSFTLLLMYSFTPTAPIFHSILDIQYSIFIIQLFRLRRPLREMRIIPTNSQKTSKFPVFMQIVLDTDSSLSLRGSCKADAAIFIVNIKTINAFNRRLLRLARNDRKSFFSLLNKVTSFIIEPGGYDNFEAAMS